MYVASLVIPVLEDQMEAYRRWAETGAQIFKDYGCLEIVECWEDFVPDGKQTDFRRAVAAEPGEKIVFTGRSGPTRRASTPPRRRCTRIRGSTPARRRSTPGG